MSSRPSSTRQSARRARQRIREQCESKQARQRANAEIVQAKEYRALQKELRELLDASELEKDVLLDRLEDDPENEELNDEIEAIAIDNVEMNDLINKIQYNLLLMNLNSVRSRILTKYCKQERVIIAIGRGKFNIRNPPKNLKNDMISLIHIYQVKVDDVIETCPPPFDMNIAEQLNQWKGKYE